jgi:hypothetical protein
MMGFGSEMELTWASEPSCAADVVQKMRVVFAMKK